MKVIELIKISRPVGWILFPIVFYTGLVISGTAISIPAIIIMIMTSFPMCLAGCGINDVYDYESDRINPRKKSPTSLEGPVLLPKNRKLIKRLSFFISLIFLLSVFLTKNPISVGIALFYILLGYSYNVPPIRLKERPPFDSISNGFIFLFLPFLLGFSLSGSLAELPLVKILWLTLCVSMIHAIGTIMDFSVDKKTGVTTFATRFGKRFIAILSFVVFLSTFLFANFVSIIIRSYLAYCTLVTVLLVIFPNEKFSRLVLKLIIAGFFISILIFLILR